MTIRFRPVPAFLGEALTCRIGQMGRIGPAGRMGRWFAIALSHLSHESSRDQARYKSLSCGDCPRWCNVYFCPVLSRIVIICPILSGFVQFHHSDLACREKRPVSGPFAFHGYISLKGGRGPWRAIVGRLRAFRLF